MSTPLFTSFVGILTPSDALLLVSSRDLVETSPVLKSRQLVVRG